MIYSLAITITAAVLLLALVGLGVVLFRRAVGAEGVRSMAHWRWYPSPLGLLLLLPIAGLLVLRLLPALLLLPIILPFLFRSRRFIRPLLFVWNLGRSGGAHHDPDDEAFDAQYRPVDDE